MRPHTFTIIYPLVSFTGVYSTACMCTPFLMNPILSQIKVELCLLSLIVSQRPRFVVFHYACLHCMRAILNDFIMA